MYDLTKNEVKHEEKIKNNNNKKKTTVTLSIDSDILKEIQTEAKQRGMSYQNIFNFIREQKKLMKHVLY